MSDVDAHRGRQAWPFDGQAWPIDGRILVLLPVYNDWPALKRLLPTLDEALAKANRQADVLIVDDASSNRPTTADVLNVDAPLRAIGDVSVLGLRRNLGHQRAIAIGLAWLERRRDVGAVVVMDADGEDDPQDVPRLLSVCATDPRQPVVFAERRRRSESPTFIVLYHAFRLIHRVLTGHGVRVGNFSVVPRRRLGSLSVVSELWNHYAAAVFRSRQPIKLVPTHRASRLSGTGTMNLTSLIVHGLSALSVWGDVIGVRLLVVAVGLIVTSTAALVAATAIRLFTDWAVPGWATAAAGLSAIALLQSLLFASLFVFTILGNRQGTSFLPRRDHRHYIAGVRQLYPEPSES